MEESLFDHIVSLTGVSRMIGDGVVRRALLDVGVDPTEATREHYEQALDGIQGRLSTFLSKEEARERVMAIRVGLRRSEFPGGRGSIVPGPMPSSTPSRRRDNTNTAEVPVGSGLHVIPTRDPDGPPED